MRYSCLRLIRAARSKVVLVLSACALTLSAGYSVAYDNPVILQYFETSWVNIENRMPDVFMAGYGSMWVPHPGTCSFGSAGYDPFDRFNLGTASSPTAFGTEATFKQMVAEAHLANIQVFPDSIMNHNGARTSDANFIADGGWPGFYVPGNGPSNSPPGLPYLSGTPPLIGTNPDTLPTGNYFWGDFHNGTYESADPNQSNYNLWLGDLVSLCDIGVEANYSMIRQPIAASTAGKTTIPPGRTRNLPDPNNARFYPDRTLTPMTFTNPVYATCHSVSSSAGSGDGQNWTMYPFNASNPLNGTPVEENATGYLMRYSAWMLEVIGVDGFRLDATKHMPQWFWNNYWDPAVFNRRTPQWATAYPGYGTRVIPYSFGEAVDNNGFIQTYIRKDCFGQRNALDIGEAGALRNILGAGGFGTWQDAVNASVDLQDDGLNNGTQGVHHVYSHDNGSTPTSSNPPGIPAANKGAWPEHVYDLFRSGVPIIYYNSREMIARFSSSAPSRFWVAEGNPTALGNTNPSAPTFTASWMPTLVDLHNRYVRGFFNVINYTDTVNQSLSDVMVFERSNNVAANVLVAIDDRYDNGFDTRCVTTTFPAGTRLHELTGVWNDTGAQGANLGGSVPELLVVDANKRVCITVPRNQNNSGYQHNRGYVVYGPAAPSGVLTVSPVASTLPADPVDTTVPPTSPTSGKVPMYMARLTPVDVVNGANFTITLTTSKTDVNDSNWDDQAYFRIDGGYVDYNGDGTPGRTPDNALDGGYENFLTTWLPIWNSARTNGTYAQSIDTSKLSEGFHYISVICYRHRSDGGLAIFTDFRKVIYVDRLPPQVALMSSSQSINTAPYIARVSASDRCTNSVYVFANLAPATDPLTLVPTSPGNKATQVDRFEWDLSLNNLPAGANSITVVAYELSGKSTVIRYDNIINNIGTGDVNIDNRITLDDLYASWSQGSTYLAQADMNRDGSLTATDRRVLESYLHGAITTTPNGGTSYPANEPGLMKGSQR